MYCMSPVDSQKPQTSDSERADIYIYIHISTSSFLLLVVMPLVPSSKNATSSNAKRYQ